MKAVLVVDARAALVGAGQPGCVRTAGSEARPVAAYGAVNADVPFMMSGYRTVGRGRRVRQQAADRGEAFRDIKPFLCYGAGVA